MTARPVTSYVIACNVCGDDLPPISGEDFTPRFASTQDAIAFLADELSDWTLLPDGYALCGSRDESHESVRETLPALNPEGH